MADGGAGGRALRRHQRLPRRDPDRRRCRASRRSSASTCARRRRSSRRSARPATSRTSSARAATARSRSSRRRFAVEEKTQLVALADGDVQDLKRRIRSVTNTRKITKAMELVAAARLRRAQERIEAMRPYADRMLELMAGTARAARRSVRLPLLSGASVQTRRDRRRSPATAGWPARSTRQILRRAFALERELRARGHRGPLARRRPQGPLDPALPRATRSTQAWTGFSDRPAYDDAQAIAHRLAELYVERGDRPGRRRLQPLRLAARPARHRAGGAADLARSCSQARRGGSRARARAARRLHLRARAGADPRAAAARLPRDGDLPRAARVGRLRAGRAHDRDAQRLEERRRADRQPHARR